MRSPTSGGGAPAPDVHGYVQMDTARGGTRYYMAGVVSSATTVTTFALTAHRVYAMPMVFARDTTLVGLHTQVTTGVGGSSMQLGIYDAVDDASNLYPNNLILDAGTVDTAAAGFKSIVISKKLTGGKLYWEVGVSDAAITVRTKPIYVYWPILGWPSTLSGYGGIGWRANLGFAALPATFPTQGSVINTAEMPGLLYSMA